MAPAMQLSFQVRAQDPVPGGINDSHIAILPPHQERYQRPSNLFPLNPRIFPTRYLVYVRVTHKPEAQKAEEEFGGSSRPSVLPP